MKPCHEHFEILLLVHHRTVKNFDDGTFSVEEMKGLFRSGAPEDPHDVSIGTIHFRRRQFFTIFDSHRQFFLLHSIGNFGQFLTPPPLKYVDVLNSCSHT